MKKYSLLSYLMLSFFFTHSLLAVELTAFKTQTSPSIDGIAEDLWQSAKSLALNDAVSDTSISIKALYDASHLYLLIQYSDNSESRRHKPLIWDDEVELYQISNEREDTFILKWDMGEVATDLTISSDVEYRADIWYWKANRTDPAGFADDKYHVYSRHSSPKSRMLTSKNGTLFYLQRKGDAGKAAYQPSQKGIYEGNIVDGYQVSEPQGSRADIRAKGHWEKDVWSIEFQRKLITHHQDDIQFYIDKAFAFAVSRFEIAGREPNAQLSQPMHGAGEVGPVIILRFE